MEATAEDATGTRVNADGHTHDHSDPRTKNAISRAGLSEGTVDPTSAGEAEANAEYVAEERVSEDPELTPTQLRRPRSRVPEDRYELAGGCYDLDGVPVTFQATDLGSYLLYGPDQKYLGATLLGAGLR